MLNRFICFGLTLLMPLLVGLPCFSAELPPAVRGVVVVTPGQSLTEAKTYATAHDKLLLSDYLETTRPGDDHDRQLKSKLERAQRAWLGGDREAARAEFRSLTEMSLKADWRNAEREVLQAADLRLAQMSDSGTEREGWLESAARLYGDLAPNAALYPPPLLAEYETIRKRLLATAVEIDLRDVFPDFKFVIVDGRKIELANEYRLAIMPGIHRLTAYSDSHETVTEFLTGSQLRVLRLSPPTLTEGVCETAKMRTRTDLPSSLNVEIYSGSNCPHDISNLLHSSQFISDPQLAMSEGASAPSTLSNKRTWLWIIGGALIAGAGYALATHHDASTEAVHRTSF